MLLMDLSVDWTWSQGKKISEFDDISIENFQIKMQRGKNEAKNQNRICKNCGTISKDVTYT